MSITPQQRERIRQRAGFACEYCGVTETDTGGELTIDHFQSQSKGGRDDMGNLVYCCHRCNEYKSDYWPQEPDVPPLWNPRQEKADLHFVELANGHLYATTAVGTLTLNRLRLNRPALIANRLQRRNRSEEQGLLTRLRDVLNLLEQLQKQHEVLLVHHHSLLQEQQHLIRLLKPQEPDQE